MMLNDCKKYYYKNGGIRLFKEFYWFLIRLSRKIKSSINTAVFKQITGNNKANGLVVQGKIDCKNRNIKIGQNVVIYQGVVF